MAPSNPTLMRAALKEALELFEHEFCYNDGRIVGMGDQGPTIGAAWVMAARIALGLDPNTGKRNRKQEEQGHETA